MVCWMRRTAGLASPRLLCKDDLESHEAVWSTSRRGDRELCSLRGTGGIFTIKLYGGFAVHRACHGVVGFTDDMKDYEVSNSGSWHQRAKAMNSKEGYPTFWQT